MPSVPRGMEMAGESRGETELTGDVAAERSTGLNELSCRAGNRGAVGERDSRGSAASASLLTGSSSSIGSVVSVRPLEGPPNELTLGLRLVGGLAEDAQSRRGAVKNGGREEPCTNSGL